MLLSRLGSYFVVVYVIVYLCIDRHIILLSSSSQLATRMATVGHIEAFNSDNERITTYLERVELFFVANEVKEDKQVATLLSVIGSKTYALLSDLLAPIKPADKPLKDLKEALQTHFEPKPVVIAERFHFHRRNQEPGETVAEYEAELRRLASSCKFEIASFVD